METIKVRTKENKDYKIYISENILYKVSNLIDLSKYSKIAILTDQNLYNTQWPTKVQKGLEKNLKKEIGLIKITECGEKSKEINTILRIWEEMQDLNLDRKSLLINLGGGVICDMGGFCASSYMRGIDFLQIPTTLLSQVDASVGGKTGFNLRGIKNCIGAFVHPIAVIIDIKTLSTLPKREFVSGFGEVIKYGFIYDQNFHNYLNNIPNKNKLTTKELIKIIKISCEIKAKVVEEDFKEKGVRKILNYGHTLGHAAESISLKTNNPLLHGEAVAIGMIGEAYMAKKMGRITESEFLKVTEIIKTYNLPTKYKTKKTEQVYQMLFKDKKTIGNQINWVLMNKIGSVEFDIKVSEEIIRQAIKHTTKNNEKI